MSDTDLSHVRFSGPDGAFVPELLNTAGARIQVQIPANPGAANRGGSPVRTFVGELREVGSWPAPYVSIGDPGNPAEMILIGPGTIITAAPPEHPAYRTGPPTTTFPPHPGLQ